MRLKDSRTTHSVVISNYIATEFPLHNFIITRVYLDVFPVGNKKDSGVKVVYSNRCLIDVQIFYIIIIIMYIAIRLLPIYRQ